MSALLVGRITENRQTDRQADRTMLTAQETAFDVYRKLFGRQFQFWWDRKTEQLNPGEVVEMQVPEMKLSFALEELATQYFKTFPNGRVYDVNGGTGTYARNHSQHSHINSFVVDGSMKVIQVDSLLQISAHLNIFEYESSEAQNNLFIFRNLTPLLTAHKDSPLIEAFFQQVQNVTASKLVHAVWLTSTEFPVVYVVCGKERSNHKFTSVYRKHVTNKLILR